MKFWKETKEIFVNTGLHFRTGVSYMLPVILIGGMVGSLAVLGGTEFSDDSIWKIFKTIGEIGLKYFVPIMAAYTAYSISDTPGIAPGFIVGILAQQIDTGYLGALFGGILVGYVTYMLLKIELTNILQSTWGFIAPVFSTIIVSLFLFYVMGPPIAKLMNFLTDFLPFGSFVKIKNGFPISFKNSFARVANFLPEEVSENFSFLILNFTVSVMALNERPIWAFPLSVS